MDRNEYYGGEGASLNITQVSIIYFNYLYVILIKKIFVFCKRYLGKKKYNIY